MKRPQVDGVGMLAVLGAACVLAALFVDNFFSWNNLVLSLGLSVTSVGIVACAMLFCLASGDFDLSVGSVVALAGVTAATLTNASGSAGVGFACGIAAGAVVGLLNGLVVARLGINALIATLASMQIVRGVGLMVSGGSAVGVSRESFYALGSSAFLLPTPVWILAVSLGVFGVLLHQTRFGRNTLAIGGNAEAARLAGIDVVGTKVAIFTLQGAMAGVAGVVSASQMTSGQPNTAQGLELRVIAACVLGGVSLSGGVGSIRSVIVGMLILGLAQNVMDLLNVPTFYQYVASGAILLAAVVLDRVKRHGVTT